MISPPAFIDTLPESFIWLQTYDWTAETSYSGYVKLHREITRHTQELEASNSTANNAGCYAIGMWFNKLMIEVFDEPAEMDAFVKKYTVSAISRNQLPLFLSFILGARRTVNSGLFDHDDWSMTGQTDLTRRWPTAWYAKHLIRALREEADNLDIHLVQFFQDYNEGLAGNGVFFQQGIRYIATAPDPSYKAKLLLEAIVNRPMPPQEKVVLLRDAIEGGSGAHSTWQWVGYWLAHGHVGGSPFKASYEQLMICLFSPNNRHSNGDLSHPALSAAMTSFKKLWDIDKTSTYPLIGQNEISGLCWAILESCTSLSKNVEYVLNMKAIDGDPWNVYDILIKRVSGVRSTALDDLYIPEEII